MTGTDEMCKTQKLSQDAHYICVQVVQQTVTARIDVYIGEFHQRENIIHIQNVSIRVLILSIFFFILL